jgi:hypothetical protein
MHPSQPTIEEVVISMQLLVNPTLPLEGDASFNHVINISGIAPSEQEIILLSPSTLPSSSGEVPFDWDGLVGYPIPHPMSFQVREIIRYIVEKVTSAITLSSSTWRDFSFPKLVSSIHKMLTFHRSPAWETWHPP